MTKGNFWYFASLFLLLIIGVSCSQTDANAASQNVTAKPSPTPVEKPQPKSAEIAGKRFEISEKNGKCTLTADSKEMELDVPAGCDFHRAASGEPRIFPKDVPKDKNDRPKDRSGVSIFIVEHSEKVEADSKDCRTTIQAVKIKNGEITKSAASTVAACLPYEWEEINYVGMFK